MLKYLLVLTLLLSACTIARYGDSFEQHATHIDKTYNKPFDELYRCLLETHVIVPEISNYSTSSTAMYALTGLTRVTFQKVGPNKTHVKASGLLPHYNPQDNIDVLDKCAKK